VRVFYCGGSKKQLEQEALKKNFQKETTSKGSRVKRQRVAQKGDFQQISIRQPKVLHLERRRNLGKKKVREKMASIKTPKHLELES